MLTGVQTHFISLDHSKDSNLLFTGTNDGKIYSWDIDTNSNLRVFKVMFIGTSGISLDMVLIYFSLF